jgi:hypothetical protein
MILKLILFMNTPLHSVWEEGLKEKMGLKFLAQVIITPI